MKHSFQWRFVLSLLLIVAALPVAVHAELMEGRDYEVISPPQPTNDPNKIEVLEYFSYGCPHCYELYPLMVAWESKKPADVSVVRAAVTVGFRQWEPLARAYYALDYSGDLKRLEPLVFKAIHEKHINLFAEENIVTWAEQQGLDRAKFASMLKSMGVESKAREAEVNARSVRIDGTPTIIVDGKYKLIGGEAKTFAAWMPLLDQLVAKARADRKSAKNH